MVAYKRAEEKREVLEVKRYTTRMGGKPAYRARPNSTARCLVHTQRRLRLVCAADRMMAEGGSYASDTAPERGSQWTEDAP